MTGALDPNVGTPRPIVVPSVHTAVRDRLRHDILSGTFPGGTRLQQSELANHYQVSVTPIREALRELAADGLIDFGPFSGAVVHAATIAELRHLHDLRVHLLPLAMRSAIQRVTEAQLEEAQRLVDEMGRTSPIETWAHFNREFHRILESAVENTYLADILLRLGDVSYLYVNISDRGAGRRPTAHAEHQELVDAFRRRDTKNAIHLALLHVTNTLKHAEAVLNDDDGAAGGARGMTEKDQMGRTDG